MVIARRTPVVRRLERFRDLPRDWQRLVKRDGTAADAVGEGLAFDQLEDERVYEPAEAGPHD